MRDGGWRSWLVQTSTAPGWQANIALRTMGPFAHPTTLAVFINSAVFFACVLVVMPQRRRRTLVLVGLALGVMGVTLFLTASRAAGGVLLAFFLLSLLSAHRGPWQVASTIVLGEIVVGFTLLCAVTLAWNFFPFSYERNAETGFASVRFYAVPEERALIHGAAVRMFLERPLTGIGPGLFGENLKRFVAFPQFEAAARFFNDDPRQVVDRYRTGPDPHSSWFGWLARAGLVGFGAMAWFFASRAIGFFRAARAPGSRGRIALLAFVFLTGFLYDGFAVEIVHLRFFWVFLAFGTAAIDGEFA
ncbi:MAG: hypothetical protein DMD82_09690 [Candidatus Rokuibacteriota bacterium]|nr:MAG: hypothetical protein DMD82_09690 [Candidatus Rokubacteria bacterium]